MFTHFATGVRRAGLALLFLGSALPATAQVSGAPPGEFNFYVLSLSWSPSFCAAEGADANRQQCVRKQPFSFVVHGLWPQYESGYPEFCPTSEPSRVPQRIAEAYLDIMPSVGVIGHQWRKHGSCSGLSQREYLALLRNASERIEIPGELEVADVAIKADPNEVEALFLAANPGMDEGGIAVTCDGRHLREVRICMTRQLDFRSCNEIDERSCRRQTIIIPPAR
ncbi:ribonuclease [Chelativorans sp. Marseille-P2723]|uniref:ribonuclease T2 family protein n=1 Tax=Chelativorans sp. Marseille-P2723 TaxID=2709133 RepID=UPI001FED6B35|nr:ribonuclease [Chelativorans sp. Marseille-P2723]